MQFRTQTANQAYIEGPAIKPGDFVPAMRTVLPSSALLAVFLCVLTSTAFALSSQRFQHWFVVPVTVCGMLCATDAIEWLRGKLDLFDPIGIIGAFSVHFFFLAPLLHIRWGEFVDLTPPPDWRDWLGEMAILNALGLIAYRICRRVFEKPRPEPTRTYWALDPSLLRLVGPVVLAISAIAQAAVYAKFGGLSGFLEIRMKVNGAFAGMGWIFMISESFPIVLTLLGIVYARKRKLSWPQIAVGLFVIFILLMIFGGLRGSRSNTLLSLFWVVGAIHFMVRPVPRKLVAAGIVFLLVFMYLYGFYKAAGTHAFSGLHVTQEAKKNRNRNFTSLLLGDLGRADIQAYILYQLRNNRGEFNYAWGRTYLGALTILIPRSILPDRPETTFREGTEIQSGSGTYVPGAVQSSRVYGLAGEAMLNFGPVSVPIVYALFGLLVGWFRVAVQRLAPGDGRLFLVPFGIFLWINILGGDSDVLVYGVVKFTLVPVLVLVICSKRLRQYSWVKARTDAAIFRGPAQRMV